MTYRYNGTYYTASTFIIGRGTENQTPKSTSKKESYCSLKIIQSTSEIRIECYSSS